MLADLETSLYYRSRGNGIFHVPSRTLEPHTIDLFTLNTLPYSYEESGDPISVIPQARYTLGGRDIAMIFILNLKYALIKNQHDDAHLVYKHQECALLNSTNH